MKRNQGVAILLCMLLASLLTLSINEAIKYNMLFNEILHANRSRQLAQTKLMQNYNLPAHQIKQANCVNIPCAHKSCSVLYINNNSDYGNKREGSLQLLRIYQIVTKDKKQHEAACIKNKLHPAFKINDYKLVLLKRYWQ